MPTLTPRTLYYHHYFLLCLSGVSGSGKTSIVDELERQNVCRRIRTTTTRPRRDGEPEDAYNFVTTAEFEALIESQSLLEWQRYGQEFYGLSEKAIRAATASAPYFCVAILGLPGVRAVKQRFPRVEAVWLDADEVDNVGEVASRMEARGDALEQIVRRLDQAYEERVEALASGLYDHRVTNPKGRPQDAVAHVRSIIRGGLGQERDQRGEVVRHPLYDQRGKTIPSRSIIASGYAREPPGSSLNHPPHDLRHTVYPGTRRCQNDRLWVRTVDGWQRAWTSRQEIASNDKPSNPDKPPV